MNTRLRKLLFTGVIILGISAFLYVNVILIGNDPSDVAQLPGELVGESRTYLPDWKLLIKIGETLRDLFIHAS